MTEALHVTEFCVMNPGFPQEPHRGPMPLAAALDSWTVHRSTCSCGWASDWHAWRIGALIDNRRHRKAVR